LMFRCANRANGSGGGRPHESCSRR
jgi:hypothetical protein